MRKYFLRLFLLSFFLLGCSVTAPSVTQTKIAQLSKHLHTLDQSVSREESVHLARDILNETKRLTKEFELTYPPLFHNTLVNIGIREKGLCYHWSDALYAYLIEKKYPHFEFHLVGSDIGEYFLEHNALVVVKKGGSIQDGIIIDPWRDSGKLYFKRVVDDRKYEWKHRKERGCLRYSPV